MLSKKVTNHIVARVSGVTKNDTKVMAAEKAISTMKMAGMDTRKAEKMLSAYKKANGLN